MESEKQSESFEEIKFTGEIPVEYIKPTLTLVIDMTEEERESHFKCMGGGAYERYKVRQREGIFTRCHKTDWCKLEREKREKKDIQRNQLLETVTDRNKVLETWARESETKQKKLELQVEKLGNLIAQLLENK
jgi:hypothetical protein